MCFNQEITGAMLALNLGAALALTMKGRPWRMTQLFFVFSAMELLQFIQYLVAGDCSSRVNQLVTALSYIHVCFQPLSISIYALRLEPNRDMARLATRLCAVAGVMGALRVPALGLGRVPGWVRAVLPGLPDEALAGAPAVCGWEMMCGPQTCAFKGALHVAWSVPLLAPSYYTPSAGFIHFLLSFGPAALAPGIYAVERAAVMLFVFITGPLLAQGLSIAYESHTPGAPSWRMEWPAIWCVYSAVQLVVALVFEICVIAGRCEVEITRGGKGHRRLLDKVRRGLLWGLTPEDWEGAGPAVTANGVGAEGAATEIGNGAAPPRHHGAANKKEA